MSKQFFEIKENADALRSFRVILRNIPVDDFNDGSWVLKPLLSIVDLMIEEPVLFDRYSEANIEWIGENMIKSMKRFAEYSEDERIGGIVLIFSLAYRFLCELEFVAPEGFAYAKATEILSDVDGRLDLIKGDAKKTNHIC